jgi:hypothetical protein
MKTDPIIVTVLRLISMGFWCWAAMHLFWWVTNPIASRIDPWGAEVFDARRPVNVVGCIAAGALLYWLSSSLAPRMIAKLGSSRSYAFAYGVIRLVAFCSFFFASVWIFLAVFELLVRRTTEHLPGQVHVDARWMLRVAFSSALPFLLFGSTWFFASLFARLITRSLPPTESANNAMERTRRLDVE